MPSRNATWRSGRRRATGRGTPRSSTIRLLHELERALIDMTARLAGDGGDLGHRLLDRKALERLPQQGVEVGRVGLRRRWRRDHDHDLAARLGSGRIVGRKRRQIAATYLLVQLGELAADRGRARPEPLREI